MVTRSLGYTSSALQVGEFHGWLNAPGSETLEPFPRRGGGVGVAIHALARYMIWDVLKTEVPRVL